MQKIEELMKKRAAELLADQKAELVLAWTAGDLFYDNAPAYFSTAEELNNLVFNDFCGSNLSKYLLANSKKDEKTAVFLKPCDTYSLNQLIKDKRVKREQVLVIGIPCAGMVDINKIKAQGLKGITGVTANADELVVDSVYGTKTIAREDALLQKCLACKGSAYAISDETLGEPIEVKHAAYDRMVEVRALEKLTPAERFAFWQQELSKCIRCNACRDVCPACSCEQCIFDNQESPVAGKANNNAAEEQLFHIIRAYHVAGRCTDCGECSRVCPQGIRLDLLNRKFIKDINEFYGEYQAGADDVTDAPLLAFDMDDIEPAAAAKGRE